MYQTILLPTDGSDHAVRAGEHARYLARLFGATVHVVNVVDVQSAGGVFDAGGVGEEFLERLEGEGERSIGVTEEVFDDTDVVQTDLRRGEPTETILDYADEVEADLIAMGTHGRRGLSRYVAGSVTERVLRLSERPVLTVRAVEGSQVDAYDEILVPTDGSQAAEAAVDHGVAIAAAAGARLHAVSVVDIAAVTFGPDYSPPGEMIERLEADSRAATEPVVSQAEARGVETVAAVLKGFPADDLLTYADDEGIDLIAMGTHGRRGLDRLLLGSTTEHVVRRADAPVLAVEAGGRDTA